MKAGQSVEQLVGEKINEYVQIHKLGPKVKFPYCFLNVEKHVLFVD